MIDLDLLSIPDDATPSELRDVCLILIEAITELRGAFNELHDSLKDMEIVEEEIVTLNRPVYLQEIPEGERWIQINERIWHRIEDNGSHSVKNTHEYETAMANEANKTETSPTPDDSTNSETIVDEA